MLYDNYEHLAINLLEALKLSHDVLAPSNDLFNLISQNKHLVENGPCTKKIKMLEKKIDIGNENVSEFESRTNKISAVQYFQFYGYLHQQQNMLQDFTRTSTYQRAILENYIDFVDKVFFYNFFFYQQN